MAPLSAALANGDDTLSITADCYSTAGTDAAITAALLAYYTSAQVDALLGDYRTGTAQDAETTSAITAALLAYYTSAQVDALLGDYHQDVFTTNQITSALVAYRSAADQDTATASSIAAALLSYYTITQVDGLLAGKLGVAEAAFALQIAVRFPDDGGADEVVAAIGEQILGPTDVSLSNWTVRPSSGCSVLLATHIAGAVSVDGYTLTLAVNPWNIVRTYNLTPGRELLFACRYRLGTASNLVVHMSEADNVYDPLYGSFVGDQGAWSTAKMYFTAPPNGAAKLRGALPGAGPAQPDGRNGGRLRPPDPGRNPETGRAHRAGQRGLRPAAVQRRELHRRVHHGRGRLGRSLLRSAHSHRHRRRGHADVHENRVRQLAEHQRPGQRGPAELRHRNHRQHTHHQQHGQRRELHHGGRRVHGHAPSTLRRSWP